MTAALLGFNPQLQSEFRDAVKAGPSQDTLSLQKYKPMRDRICTILAEAWLKPEISRPTVC